jgi:hypothetical protein
MPIQHAIWKVGAKPLALATSRLPSEKLLEEMIVADARILSSEWMLIGQQEKTSYRGIIDLLAIAPDGSLVLIELKRDLTPKEVVAQALDYASWVEELTAHEIDLIYKRFSGGGNLSGAFQARFGVPLDEDALNASHQIIIVAAALDAATERIIAYLNARDIAINAVFFQVFDHGDAQLLSRAWLIDPSETQANVASASKGPREPWNGEFYVSYGGAASRSWAEARKYGFISAGGGTWYSQTLTQLVPGDRVWVKVPKTGYVGVARVLEPAVRADAFTVPTAQGDAAALQVLNQAALYKRQLEVDPDTTEFFVRVEWLDTVDEAKAIDEVGLFGNQNTVCKPTAPKWRHTVDRLKTAFPNWDGTAKG